MIDMVTLLTRWQVDEREVRQRMYRAPTPRERERWHALWLLARRYVVDDDNADEAIWDWIREEVTANTCLGTKAPVREHVGAFLHGLSARAEDVKRRCRTVLQAQADALAMTTTELIQAPRHVDPTLTLV
jgi:hypothetical protein